MPSRSARLGLAAAVTLAVGIWPAIAFAAGPPYPPPTPGTRVYDTAGVLAAGTERAAESTIASIEQRTGAQIVVYTQLASDGVTTEDAERDAIALMDQWGVGRKGFDDGLVILFDLRESDDCHGEVQLYAGPGFRATFLSNEERQSVFENDMLPLLRDCRLDDALLEGLAKVDARATPEHAATLERARQIDAVLGLVVAPLLLVVVAAWGAWHWLRYGRDPVYLDDPSIHIPAAPPGLTPAAGALVFDGKSTRRTLTTAMVDLASRGSIRFIEERTGFLGRGRPKVGIDVDLQSPPATTPEEERRRHLQTVRPISSAESFAYDKLRDLSTLGHIDPDEVPRFAQSVTEFNRKLETYVVEHGWFGRRPTDVFRSWLVAAGVVGVGGGALIVLGANLPSQGLVVVGAAGIAAGLFLALVANVMPARTMPGAMIRAMLAAYRRTLQTTMAQARSMGEVVEQAAIPLVQSADDAVVWGVALGLHEEVERVLQRTVDDLRDGRVSSGYVPGWYGTGSGSAGSGGSGAGFAPGLMSSSAVPNFGGMMAALSTIGTAPGGGGAGGFGGGGSGGGGGGAGGSF
ncbi:MAG: TPM domain-containing protein [Chloroflexota bacterium]